MQYDRTIIAYHGCDASTADHVLQGKPFKQSENRYDWLGSGIYFWEWGLDRALRFAEFQKSQGKVRSPVVVGALIQLGECFDLMDTKYTSELSRAYKVFRKAVRRSGQRLPVNRGKTPDRKLRHRDCAVMNFYLERLNEAGIHYDSVRSCFVEGKPVFPGSGIFEESHIQLCIRNPACILGVFRP